MVHPQELKEAAQDVSVLYVEDDQVLRQNTVRLLSSFFSSIETAKNGVEGLEKYKKGRYDLVITDIKMPLMDGVKLARTIKADNPQQVVIVISAHDEARYFLELINLGADYFVLKPLDIRQFLTVLDKAIKLAKFTRMEKEQKRKLEITVPKNSELREALNTSMSSLLKLFIDFQPRPNYAMRKRECTTRGSGSTVSGCLGNWGCR